MLHLPHRHRAATLARARGSRTRARLAPLVLVSLLATALLAGCGAIGDPLAAVSVNGHTVSLAAYQRILSIYEISSAQQGQSVSWQTPDDRSALSRVQQAAVDFLVSAQLIHQQVQSQHLTVDAKDVQETLKAFAGAVESAGQQNPSNSDYHTLVVGAQQAAKQDATKVDILGLMAGRPSVADAFMLFGYDEAEQKTLMDHVKVPQAHLRVIQTATEQDAKDILKQITEQHADFGELAKQKSLDQQTAPSGGELGNARVGQLAPIDSNFDRLIFGPSADYAAKTSYAIVPYQGKFILCEITQRSTVAISSLSDPQTQADAFNAWLGVVVRPAADIQQFVAVDPTPTTAPPALGG